MPPAPDTTSALTERQRLNRYRPKSHSDEECAAALRIIDEWNKLFRGVDGASVAQRGNGTNVRHCVRVLRRCQKEGPPFDAITEDTIKAAIVGYRNDSWHLKERRWKAFKDWLDPELILKYAGQSTVQTLDPRRDQAVKVIRHLALDRAAKMAEQTNTPLHLYIRGEMKSYGARRNPAYADQVFRWNNLQSSFEDLSSDARARLADRARVVFECGTGKLPVAVRDDVALSAISLALMDLDARKQNECPRAAGRMDPPAPLTNETKAREDYSHGGDRKSDGGKPV